MLERNNCVELRPTLQELYGATRQVCEDLMALMEDLPRLALQGTPRQLKELEVRPGHSSGSKGWLVHGEPEEQTDQGSRLTH